MHAKLAAVSICLFMILPMSFQTPLIFRDQENYNNEGYKISFPKTGQSESGYDLARNEYLDDEVKSDSDVDYLDEKALQEFITDLKRKGDDHSNGVPTWKPDFESNDVWSYKSFLNELVSQSRKSQQPKMRMPEN